MTIIRFFLLSFFFFFFGCQHDLTAPHHLLLWRHFPLSSRPLGCCCLSRRCLLLSVLFYMPLHPCFFPLPSFLSMICMIQITFCYGGHSLSALSAWLLLSFPSMSAPPSVCEMKLRTGKYKREGAEGRAMRAGGGRASREMEDIRAGHFLSGRLSSMWLLPSFSSKRAQQSVRLHKGQREIETRMMNKTSSDRRKW